MSHGDKPNYGSQPNVATEPYPDEILAKLRIDAAEVVGRYPQKRSALLPLLHLVQSVDGYVSTRGIEFCAETVELTAAEVSGVATFYTQYKRHPNGDYTIGVCTNTLCAVMGGDAIWDAVSEHLAIGHDETTTDGRITLERVECNAGCDYAPVVMANWEFFDNQTPESVIRMVDALREGKVISPTRGAATVATFKEVSRVLAGFHDGRAVEGDTAGPATVRGLRHAKEKGWHVPAAAGEGAGATGTAYPASSVPGHQPARSTGSQDTPSNAPGEKPGASGNVGKAN
ncbi:NADH dehydrogenase subunit E [Austwickia chelonae]|uniref:NADH-quinone oxidoreductase subunit E n=1 Tax=Austwickia chelonae NBRC 105200 TaxID=1184607 RepID=K6UME5_9MICO|nr:NADH-quinone oxidoreductase subunit NuoE [Austwickia chelonae]GAB78051.1 NADH-quinone oxidoreductase subunit E [Austwickia chelonae NBRC 105200]SEV95207.1 NADH dehydrogenase subunit E [Austwickia chelonae]